MQYTTILKFVSDWFENLTIYAKAYPDTYLDLDS